MAFSSYLTNIYISPEPGEQLEIRTAQGNFISTDIWADPQTKNIYFKTKDGRTYNFTIYDVDTITYIASEDSILQIPIQLEDGSVSHVITTTGPSTIDIFHLQPIYRTSTTYNRNNIPTTARARVWLKLAHNTQQLHIVHC